MSPVSHLGWEICSPGHFLRALVHTVPAHSGLDLGPITAYYSILGALGAWAGLRVALSTHCRLWVVARLVLWLAVGVLMEVVVLLTWLLGAVGCGR
ncbi:hypothetical protein F5Y17DRAFT_419469 [Xylariaceae sp. FL0594]|nr:hypothetical protein F5Y17DRAFT_419469 [Xylariaceae sp. FL0594]